MKCIDNDKVCDGVPNCRYESDENPELCAEWNCTTGKWKCHSKRCIDAKLVCDRQVHCSDGSDELPEACAQILCGKDQWRCATSKRCIDLTKVCNYQDECGEEKRIPWPGYEDYPEWLGYFTKIPSSDEENELCESWQCPQGKWKCDDGRCIATESVCPYRRQDSGACKDGSHKKPELCENWNCTAGFWKCKNNECVIDQVVCNGHDLVTCFDG